MSPGWCLFKGKSDVMSNILNSPVVGKLPVTVLKHGTTVSMRVSKNSLSGARKMSFKDTVISRPGFTGG